MAIFQSTLSVRRATKLFGFLEGRLLISIHALRKESDLERRWHKLTDEISIHALRKESDQRLPRDEHIRLISIHALRKESDYQGRALLPGVGYFNPRSP